jgi:hypothetical protein
MDQNEPRRPPVPASSHSCLGGAVVGTVQLLGTQRMVCGSGGSGEVVTHMPSGTKAGEGGMGFHANRGCSPRWEDHTILKLTGYGQMKFR